MKYFLIIIITMLTLTLLAKEETERLVLPKQIYTVPGIEMNVYFKNVFLSIKPSNFFFKVTCSKGQAMEKRWTFVASAKDIGTYDWKLEVFDDNGKVAEGTMKLEVIPKPKLNMGEKSILMIGDSLTDQTHSANRLHALLPKFKMIGSHAGLGKKLVPGGIAHEGYGGWTWYHFTLEREPVPPKILPYRTNKFLKKNSDGYWKLNMSHYFAEYNNGKLPDFVIIQLGVNDIFAKNDANINEAVKNIGKSMDKLIGAIRKAAPKAFIGIGLVTPSAGQDAFGKNYKCNYNFWQYRKNIQKLNAFYLKKVENMAKLDSRISIIPTCLNLDTENNFPASTAKANAHNEKLLLCQNNAVHPAKTGYYQIGDTFYCWVISRLCVQ